MTFGQADWRGILQSVSKRDYLRYVCYLAEMGMAEIVKSSKLTQKPIIGSMFIIDMEGLSTRQMTYKPCEFYFKTSFEIKINFQTFCMKFETLDLKP